ncbi:MAG: TIGR03936 family radical SAM-associated protein [Eubacteriales bacterium]
MDDRLVFAKDKQSKYISHLDLMRTFQRGFSRAGIQIKHTEGFNPHPFVSIGLPLSVGYSSQCELMEFGLVAGCTHEELPQKLTAVMPTGIEILECYRGEQKLKHIAFVTYHIAMHYDNGKSEEGCKALQSLLEQESHIIEKKSKKAKSGSVKLDIIPHIRSFELSCEGETVTLKAILSAQNPGLNPELIRKALTDSHPELAPDFVTCHRESILDKDGNLFR